MNPADTREKAQFAAVLAGLAEILLRDPLTKSRIAAYYDALKDLRIEAVTYAAKELLKTENFFPTPAKIREHARMWKAPALAPGRETKMLESKEQREERILSNAQRFRELRESLERLDESFGTNLEKKVGNSLTGD